MEKFTPKTIQRYREEDASKLGPMMVIDETAIRFILGARNFGDLQPISFWKHEDGNWYMAVKDPEGFQVMTTNQSSPRISSRKMCELLLKDLPKGQRLNLVKTENNLYLIQTTEQ